MKKEFTWVNTHEQIVDYLSTKENSQQELISLLKSIGIGPFNDKSTKDGHNIELEEIDPFTFFCYLYKYGSKTNLSNLQKIAKTIDVEKPVGVEGIPTSQAQRVWMFPYKYERTNNEIERLWRFFHKAINNSIENKDFQDILKIKNIGLTKITEVLFYIRPKTYLPINGPTKPYLQEVFKLDSEIESFNEYLSLIDKIRSKTSIPFYEFSYNAWLWKNENSDQNVSFSEVLLQFLKQAKTTELKTKHYQKSFNGTDVKVSFGMGVAAKIPWISFLIKPYTTSNGIYPVYLYYKAINKLILAYGISETNIPLENWNIETPITLNNYFKKISLPKPERYGSSYLYKDYDVNNLPDAKILDNDLNSIIKIYKQNTSTKGDIIPEEPSVLSINQFIDSLNQSGLIFNPTLITRFTASLLTKPFVILTGLSGSGKTMLANAFVKWICQNKEQYCIVPVGADWTNREPLLGYPNAINTKEYVKPDNGALDVIIHANKNPELPHFLILDEMNLSHVERYFADFLSVMETNDKISLFSEDRIENGVPAKLALPENLFIIGTVNIDETTYMFSPKVLDRANTIEFRVTKDEIENFFSLHGNVDMTKLESQGTSMAHSFLEMAKRKEFEDQDMVEVHKKLVIFFQELKKAGAEFGYRTANEIIRLINQLSVINTDLTEYEKLDIAIMQKLLPKLHGSRRKLTPVLTTLAKFCIVPDKITNIEKEVFGKDDFEFTSDNVLFPVTLEKIHRMYNGAIDNGFASYAEA